MTIKRPLLLPAAVSIGAHALLLLGFTSANRDLPAAPDVIGIVLDLLDNPPAARYRAAPIYPFEAKREGLRGEVVVEFTVNERGEVLSPRVVSSSSPIFEEATLRAVSKWKFEPGRKDGRPVRFRMSVPVIFSLHE